MTSFFTLPVVRAFYASKSLRGLPMEPELIQMVMHMAVYVFQKELKPKWRMYPGKEKRVAEIIWACYMICTKYLKDLHETPQMVTLRMIMIHPKLFSKAKPKQVPQTEEEFRVLCNTLPFKKRLSKLIAMESKVFGIILRERSQQIQLFNLCGIANVSTNKIFAFVPENANVSEASPDPSN